jgi:hypothetical protein
MINGYAYLQQVKPGDFEKLIPLAKEDNHGVYVPTHLVMKGSKIAGFFSVGAPGVPVVFAWLSTKEISPRESFSLINTVENFVAMHGAQSVAFPVPKSSPFHELMPQLGFQNTGEYTFFVKKLAV